MEELNAYLAHKLGFNYIFIMYNLIDDDYIQVYQKEPLISLYKIRQVEVDDILTYAIYNSDNDYEPLIIL